MRSSYADTAGRSRHEDPLPLFSAPTIAQADAQGEVAMGRVKTSAETKAPGFTERATEFVAKYLREHGDTSGEDIVTACKNAGINPSSE